MPPEKGKRSVPRLMITGRPGVGKTTLIKRLINRLGQKAGGFFTEEIREEGRRVGFAIADTWSNRGILAHLSREVVPQGPRVGKYTVNVADIERIAVAALRRAARESRVVVCDEIAKMELFCPAFAAAVEECLNTPVAFVGTLQQSQHPFILKIRGRKDVEVLVLTPANRDEMLQHVLARLAIED